MSETKLTDEVRAALEAKAQGIPPDIAEQQKALAQEWGTWVATQDIQMANGALAYRKGDAVPKANVDAYSYDQLGWVAKRDTKAGEAAIAETTPEDTTGKVK